MQVRTDWRLDLDPDAYATTVGPSFARLTGTPARAEAFREALAEARHLAAPAACWDAFPVREIRHEHVVLAGGAKLGGGPVASVVGGAEELVVAVCTLGQAVSDRIESYSRKKQIFQGALLDGLASWGVDLVRQQFCTMIEQDAAAAGLRVSALLSPGESEWSIRDQRVIFSLLDASRIGVRLSDSMVMRPLKSLSMIMGRGSRPMGVEGASNCDFCTMRERCNFRRAQPATRASDLTARSFHSRPAR